MIESARSTDWTPPSLGSGSLYALDFGSMALRRITFRFIATCIYPLARFPEHDESAHRVRGESPSPEAFGFDLSPQAGRGDAASRITEAASIVQLSEQARTARPFVLRTQHLDRQFGRVGIGRDAVLVEIFGGLLDLDVAGERGDDRLHKTLRLHLLLHLDHVAGEHHRRGDDGVPVAEDQRMDALVGQTELDGVDIGDRRLAAGDVDRVAGGAERR